MAYDESNLETDLARRLKQTLAIWKAEAKSREKKAAAARALPFPHDQSRPGQKLMMDAVGKALAAGDHLLAEAPTGSGKTAASLFLWPTV